MWVMDDEAFATQLQAWAVDGTRDADVRVERLRRTSAGMSRENWVFDLVTPTRTEPLIARRDPLGSVLETDREVETALLQALAASRVPAPRVRWLDSTGRWLGRPAVVMERAEGTCDWFVLSGDRPADERLA